MSGGSKMHGLLWYAVTGGRNLDDYDLVAGVLDEERPSIVVQGECPYGGADRLAKLWCRKNGVICIGMEAMFSFYGRPAGPMRNAWMLDYLPIYKLIAFPGDRGTANCVAEAEKREILVRDERHRRPYP